jgi:hypothetical protein
MLARRRTGRRLLPTIPMQIRRLVPFALLLLLLGACQIGGVQPLPIAGVVPRVVAIWPLATGGEPPDADFWFAGLASALGRRGYRVLPQGITAQLLRTSDIADLSSDDEAIGDEAIGRALRADAVLHVDVRRFEVDQRSGLQNAEWDLEWRLMSTRGYGQQWIYNHHGHYHQADRVSFDPGRSLDEQHEPRDIVPVGGNRMPSFRSAADLLLNLNNTAMARLPQRIEPESKR